MLKGKSIYLNKEQLNYLFEILISQEMDGDEIATQIKDKL